MTEDQFGPVFPVIPSYSRRGRLDLDGVAKYVRFLDASGAMTIMTTAGTSQFNLLDPDEVMELNECAAANFSRRVVCGLPCLPERLLTPVILESAARLPSACLMLLYPERSYRDADIVGFFRRMTRLVPNRFYLHGLPMRAGTGGSYDYGRALVEKLAVSTPNLVGMKEESSSYESGFAVCASRPAHRAFEFIVAGGSMRRFLLLQAAGAQSFFAGVGSLCPPIELAFMRAVKAGDLQAANRFVVELEKPVFDVFMRIGWHPALRHAAKRLRLIGEGERRPSAAPTRASRLQIDTAVDALCEKVALARSAGSI